MNLKKTSPRAMELKAQRQIALSMRREGYTYTDIAKQIGRTPQRAQQIVTEELNKAGQATAEDAAEIVKLALLKLDDLWRAMYPKAMQGSERSAEVCLKVIERRMRILGIEGAGLKLVVELSGPEGKPVQTESHGAVETFVGKHQDIIRRILFGDGDADPRLGGKSVDTDGANDASGGVPPST